MTELVQDNRSAFNNVIVFRDKELEDNGTSLTSDAYNSQTDRFYDVRGFLGIFIQMNNQGNSDPINITIDITVKHYDNLSNLLPSDFVNEVPEELVAANAFSTPYENVRATPKITAFRVRLNSADDVALILKGVVSVN